MGDACSCVTTEEEIRRVEKLCLDYFVMELSEGPDLRVNKNIMMFTGLASSDNLRRHYQKRKMEASDVMKNVVEKLGDLTSAPELAGVGALAVAVLIDNVSFSPPEESIKGALRRVFAEAAEVLDQIDRCLERYTTHIKNKDELTRDIHQIQHLLSAALAKLKNSMVRDGHMSSEALKAWVNGAAFHIQMLIHLVRLGGIQTCDPVEKLLLTYQSDLELLFRKHEEVIDGKCSFIVMSYCMSNPGRYLVDEDSKRHVINPLSGYEKYFEVYYDHRYGGQEREIQKYFSDVRQNLQQLVRQTGSFNVNLERGSEI